ncbi:TetR/AcrR family transcriptional regulator [Sulfitobacter donghicola]|uniref:TetR family transcriptional regulator n=1 Tax=Sulfitobacter donghicola DSW-25 = KCTC 12864 = JCM 14565 TaxID=1300350 RepID=A0A073IEV6_9RHOB|nr:TetR/AcrR family transcriptional regulator [Sulfitobacter donghicola]KEJ88055.1 TetR family transcriptional regulator [Sulfitobacter donghicola DSW-25 = KCTC 12864 = JCM 14565]KIN68729.1 TetR family transcriptional regulator [Sulfitobacter donghicola DSW-25 = KCTC 12864 = JCM 14565]
MARPYSFDPKAALETAMHVFWRDGYDMASLSSLQSAMGIQRGSLYQEFGSKKGLFLKALDRYVEDFVDPGIALLMSPDGAGQDRIDQFFALIPDDEKRGCLLCNSAAGAAGTDDDVRSAISEQLERLRKAFDYALADDDPDPAHRRAKAEQLTQMYIGIRVEARAGS